MTPAAPSAEGVLTLGDGLLAVVSDLLRRHGLSLHFVPDGAAIPGSYHGAPEAGLVGTGVWVRADTPLHSVLHEACHAICMGDARRLRLERDAGGDFDEENAVCCLQIVLAGELAGVGEQRLMQDMDRWGYTFRLGSAQRWYAEEAAEPRRWLVQQGLLDAADRPTYRMRE